MNAALSLIEYSDDLACEFKRINAEWISATFVMEPTDHDILDNPRARIVDMGGAILFVAIQGVGIVGTCALKKTGQHSFELTKMGVTDVARGQKAGEFLLAHVINRAKAMGARELYLLTNRKCAVAIYLYEKLGFVHDAGVMARYGATYQRCDVAMDYPLTG
jgi:GNAT superfamily N-acetyltransferase